MQGTDGWLELVSSLDIACILVLGTNIERIGALLDSASFAMLPHKAD